LRSLQVLGFSGRVGCDLTFLGLVAEAVVALLSTAAVGLVVTPTRAMVLRRGYLVAIFVYAAAAAGLDTILGAVSPDGTAGSVL
jgi:hypothetical protein